MPKRCLGCMKIKNQSPVCEHCGYNENVPNDFHQLPVGTLLQGRYQVGKVLGQGGFGITYVGWDQMLETVVAIKEYYPNSFVHRENSYSLSVTCNGSNVVDVFARNRERFLREARILAKLSKVPGVVRVQNLFAENNTAYIIMEYVEGIDLKRYIRMQGRTLTAEEVFSVMRPVMYALSKVHEADLVHRDISPDNIMIQKDGSVILLDFGAAKVVENADVNQDLTQSTEAILKHGFAPVEQYRGKGNLGPWTDVYALCATMYYCMTGRVPNSSLERIMGDDNVNWHQVPGLTAQQIAVLEKAMAVLPEQRIQSVKELYDALFTRQTAPEAPQPPKAEPKPAPVREMPEAVPVEQMPETAPLQRPTAYPSYTVPLEDPAASPMPKAAPALAPAVMETKPKKKKLGIIAAAVLVAVAGNSLLKPQEKEVPRAQQDVPTITETAAPGTLSAEEWQYQEADALEKAGELGKAAIAFGKLGDYEDARQRSFALWDKVAQRDTVSAGVSHTVGLNANGTVVAVGRDGHGQCNVENWCDIIAVGAGDDYAVGLKADGTVVAVGDNEYGQCNVENWSGIIAVSAGNDHAVGLKADGTVVAVGNNSWDGGRSPEDETPGRCDVGNWSDIIAVSAGSDHTVGLKADGTVVGVGEYVGNVANWRDIIAVSAGNRHTVGLKVDGTVVVVGDNAYGQCNVGDWRDIIAVSVGDYHTVGLKADGTVVVAGKNRYGQCNVGDWRDIIAVSVSDYHTVGLKADGTVVAVGDNFTGRCDVSDWTNIKLPAENH